MVQRWGEQLQASEVQPSHETGLDHSNFAQGKVVLSPSTSVVNVGDDSWRVISALGDSAATIFDAIASTPTAHDPLREWKSDAQSAVEVITGLDPHSELYSTEVGTQKDGCVHC